jgi:tripartite-type tricarboxylate transporter receptor subunit TctC
MIASAASAAVAASGKVFAGNYPDHTITMYVGFAPGGGTDVTARLVSKPLSLSIKQSVVVENKPGAAGTLATSFVERASPDGYTILMDASGAFIHNILKSNYAYEPLAVSTPISGATRTPVVMIVNKDFPVNTVEEFVKLAKEKHLSYGSDGVAGTTHLCGEYFARSAGIELLHVPFSGAGPSVVATVSGQVDANFPTMPSALAMIRSGKLKALAVSGNKRSPVLPDVPTFDELGFKDFDFICWFGVVGPKGIAQDVVAKLNGGFQSALKEKEVRENIEGQGMEVMLTSPKEWLDFMAQDAETIKRMARFGNLQL